MPVLGLREEALDPVADHEGQRNRCSERENQPKTGEPVADSCCNVREIEGERDCRNRRTCHECNLL